MTEVEPSTVSHLLGAQAATPDRVALVAGEVTLTYGELERAVRAAAGKLLAEGGKSGEPVAVLGGNVADTVIALLAAGYAGLPAVPINFRLRASEIEQLLQDSGSRVLVVTPDFEQAGAVAAAAAGASVLTTPLGGDLDEPAWATVRGLAALRLPGEPVEMIMYTSGTTGRPKGVIWKRRTVLLNALAQQMTWRFRPGDRVLVSGPVYHVGPLHDLVFPPLLAGATCVLAPTGGLTGERLLQMLIDHCITATVLYPIMLYRLLELPGSQALMRDVVPELRTVLVGGDLISAPAIEDLQRRLPGVEVFTGYGLTDGAVLATTYTVPKSGFRPGCIGRPTPLVDARVVDEEGRECLPGTTGEIVLSGPVVPDGYWRRPQETAATYRDGWCHTGDLGETDEEGLLYFRGRAKDIIRTGAENVSAAEVEQVLFQHPLVSEVAVVGVPDERWGERIVAYVVAAAKEVDSAEMIEFCRVRMASYKKPSEVVLVEELPRNASGKVLKQQLRETPERAGA